MTFSVLALVLCVGIIAGWLGGYFRGWQGGTKDTERRWSDSVGRAGYR